METTKAAPVSVLRTDDVNTELIQLLSQRWLVIVAKQDTEIVIELYET